MECNVLCKQSLNLFSFVFFFSSSFLAYLYGMVLNLLKNT